MSIETMKEVYNLSAKQCIKSCGNSVHFDKVINLITSKRRRLDANLIKINVVETIFRIVQELRQKFFQFSTYNGRSCWHKQCGQFSEIIRKHPHFNEDGGDI